MPALQPCTLVDAGRGAALLRRRAPLRWRRGPRSTSHALLVLSLAYALAMFHRTAFTELAASLGQEGTLSAPALAWVGSAFFWAYLGCQVPAGVLVDAVGPRRVSALGSAAMALGAAALAAAVSAAWLAAGRALCAAGAVSVFMALIAYCGRHFGTASTSALGRSLLIGNLGGVASGAPLALAITWFGWRHAWWALALASAAACAATLLLVDDDGPGKPLATSIAAASAAWAASLRGPEVYLGAGALAGLAGAFHAFTGLGAHLVGAGLGLRAAGEGLIVSAMVCGFAFGALLWGRLGDTPQVRGSIVRMASLAALAVWASLAVVPPTSAWALGALLVLAGVLCAAFSIVYALLDGLCADGASGAVKATANCGIATGAAVAQVAQGHLPAHLAVLPCIALAVLGVVCCWGLAWRDGARRQRGLHCAGA